MTGIDIYIFAVFGAVGALATCLGLLIRRQRRVVAEGPQIATPAQAAADRAQVKTQRKKVADARQNAKPSAKQSETQAAYQAQFAMAAENAMLDLKTSIEALATCMANLELRLRSVDQRQHKMDDMSAQLLRRRGFDEALDQVREGKPALEVARRCALPLAEVELLQRIHRQSATH